jgi:hypothetical protein
MGCQEIERFGLLCRPPHLIEICFSQRDGQELDPLLND